MAIVVKSKKRCGFNPWLEKNTLEKMSTHSFQCICLGNPWETCQVTHSSHDTQTNVTGRTQHTQSCKRETLQRNKGHWQYGGGGLVAKKVKVKSLSLVQLFGTPWTVVSQAPLSMGFSRQYYWSGLPFPSPGDLPNPEIKPRCPTLQTLYQLSHERSP